MVEYFKGFSLADHTLPTYPEPAWQKMAQSPLNGITQPGDIHGQPVDRRWLTKREKNKSFIRNIIQYNTMFGIVLARCRI